MTKVSRNDPCPCGSGKKYKQCCQLQQAATPPTASVAQWLQAGLAQHKSGQLEQAQAQYQQILQAQPRHAEAQHLSGLIHHAQGRLDLAEPLMTSALQSQPNNVMYLSNLGNLLQDLGKYPEAVKCYQRALQQRRDIAELHNNLGNAWLAQGQWESAVACYRQALTLNRDYAAAWMNLGLALRRLGRLADAVEAQRQLIKRHPQHLPAHHQLGELLLEMGDLEAAAKIMGDALSVAPGDAATLNNLGNVHLMQSRLDEAAACFSAAIASQATFAVAHHNLGQVLMRQQQWWRALQHLAEAVKLQPIADYQKGLGHCLRRFNPVDHEAAVTPLLEQALRQAWARPVELAKAALVALRGQCGIRNAWAGKPSDLTQIAGTPLLLALLKSTPVPDGEVERWLTQCRRELLDLVIRSGAEVSADVLEFYAALAQQCFINEYVYGVTDDESQQVATVCRRLIQALAEGKPADALSWICLACYQPLASIDQVQRVLEHAWPEPVVELLRITVEEPRQEARLAANMPRLTPVVSEVSHQVQQQYEQNPYPRWIKTLPASTTVNLQQHLRQMFPHARFTPPKAPLEMLVAGCGTGQQSIQSAQYFRHAQMLAVDLSLSSLAYAKRKTTEFGLTNIEYAQADILQLGSIDRRFDLIESTGVLHHLAEPLQGWRVLVDLLRPGGYMRLAFYSELARQAVVATRAFIAERQFPSTLAGIRACRQALAERPDLTKVTTFTDFYSTSGCRDLLFHVQEHRYTLPLLQQQLEELNLTLLGFDLEPGVNAAYQQQFPNDPSMTNLQHWHEFELMHPDTFSGMYQFWVQKSA